MATYEIHGREASGDREAALLALRATKAGFSFAAFVFGPFWLAARRLWLPLIVYGIAAVVAFALVVFGILGLGAAVVLAFVSGLFIGFEGSGWRSDALTRRGAPVLDVIEASGAEEAVERFVASRRALP